MARRTGFVDIGRKRINDGSKYEHDINISNRINIPDDEILVNVIKKKIKPQSYIPDYSGFHNSNPNTKDRIEKSKSYQDLSTICIVPAIKPIPPKIVQAWRNMMTPMNNKFFMMMAEDKEVGAAYSDAIEMILAHPDLSTWKYLLCLETDNAPPPDGLLKLYESIDKYDVVSGLYFCKGEMGAPMAYGKTDVFPVNFIPFLPPADSITPVRGTGMGFCLFRLDMFKDKRFPKPFFQTVQRYEEGRGAQAYTQDLKWAEEAGKLGYKLCVDSRVKVGHYDYSQDKMW